MIKILKKIKYKNKGSMLLMAILVLTGILSVSLISSNIVIKGLKMSNVQSGSTKAYFASETGIERALWEVRKNGYSYPGTDDTDPFNTGIVDLSNNSSYNISYATNSPSVFFTSTGSYENTNRSIQVTFKTFDCTTNCTGRECGNNGCGGFCEPGCGSNSTCNDVSGICECDDPLNYSDCDDDNYCECNIGVGKVCDLEGRCCTPVCDGNCGDDGCGNSIGCGECTVLYETCGGGGEANVCGCTPTTCVAQGKECGPIEDGCGGIY